MDLSTHVVKKKNSSAVISCHSAVKLNLQKLLNLTQLAPSTLNKTLFNTFLGRNEQTPWFYGYIRRQKFLVLKIRGKFSEKGAS